MKNLSRIFVAATVVTLGVMSPGCDSSDGVGTDAGIDVNIVLDGSNDGTTAEQNDCVAPTKGPTTHPASINADETWTADTSPHELPFDTTFYKTVTLEPCAEVLIGAGKQITLRDGGKLLAEGTATRRIHIGANDPALPFANIRTINSGSARFAYTLITGGGVPLGTAAYAAGTLEFGGDTQKPTQELLHVDHVRIEGSKSNGIVLTNSAGFTAASNALEITGAEQHPISVWARSVGNIPTGSYTGNAIDKILIPATSGNETINETTTLRDRGVPYLVGQPLSGGDLRVDIQQGQPGVTLTIEAGVTMRFKKGGVFHIAVASGTNPARGSLIAVGTAAKPIVFTSDEATPAAGDWIGLRFGELPTTLNKLDYVRVEHAGGTSSSGSGSCPDNTELLNDAAIRITGWPTTQFITNTTILGSPTNGIDRGWRDDRVKIDFLAGNTFTNIVLCNQTYPPNAANVCPQPQDQVPCPKN